jgi:hypothetical protein
MANAIGAFTVMALTQLGVLLPDAVPLGGRRTTAERRSEEY